MLDGVSKNSTDHMEKALKILKDEFSKLRTGRASPAILDVVRVEYYGTVTPLNQMASINCPEPRMLVVQPWDVSSISAIEKAIQKSELGLNPQNDGKIIRLPFPPLTEERRKDLVKVAHKIGEESRIAVRNVRRNSMEEIKKLEKDKKISEDDGKRGQHKIQEITDHYIKKVDMLVDSKSKEILEV
ncbi:MAG TPA: ribosome recycling factor [Bdellovibrionota bacterium]|nr:ribosome recycling factor [Bdellovibrionota bacterium]